MNLLALFSVGEKVWVKMGATVFAFIEGEVKELTKERIEVLLEDGVYSTYSVAEATERVFKKLSLINLYVKGFNEYKEGASEYQLSKEKLIEEIQGEMLSLQFCGSCKENEGIDEELNIKGLKFIGTVYELFGEVENYKLEGVYQLNGDYYVSYDAGNSHCHIGLMDEQMTKVMNSKFPSGTKGR